MQNRRAILLGGAAVGVAAAATFAAWRFWWSDQYGPLLPDMALGSDKAPVTVVEYASMTCPHCAHFDQTTFPEIKKRYIDTGKVRFVLREFPLDDLAMAASMLARCAGNGDAGKYFALVDTLFHEQPQWLVDEPLAPLTALAKRSGFTDDSFNQCLANQDLLDGIERGRQHALDVMKVRSTPTFFINGTAHAGAISAEDMAKLIDPYLKGG